MKQHLKLKKTKGDLLGDSTAYRRLSGQLLYLTHTRADSYAMCTLNQFFDQPRKPHLDAAMKVLQYLKQYPGQGLLFPSSSEMHINAFCDAD